MDQISISSSQFQALTSPEVSVIGNGQGISIWVLGVLVTLKALGNETGGTYALFEDMVLPGVGPPLHLHTNEEESWYVLDGEMTWTVGGKELVAKQGSFIHLPRLVPHTFANRSKKPARMLLTFAPAGFENWFLEIGKPALLDLHGNMSPPELTEEDMKNADEAAKKYGMILTGHLGDGEGAETS